ncbi:general transcription factor IIE subunit 2-like protein [Dinothrombium tinctorium]|uniref:Transcription initiation factor IIE subunit beta n=1 Tax=Dinothrombium tinctorium TaxID=1965070 RepID=A0A3S3NMG7_9ACAR|nr:general transcription factor IIE subunit 2-like protein [Dinothrombium tinctorium]
MDPNLLKEREAFKKKAFSMPVVEKRKEKKSNDETPPKKKVKKESTISKDPFAYKSMSGTSQYNFAVLAKIVKHMKQRHLEGDSEPLTLEEILDETNQLDLSQRQRVWLQNEALNNNPKIGVTEEGKYVYKPTFQLKDRKSLLRLLDKYDQRGLGGIHLEDIQESLPNADKILKILADSVIIITRPVDKKKIVFYKDKSMQFRVDEEFQKLWRSVAVDGIDETKIDDYLQKQGITSMQDLGVKKLNPIQKRKKPTSRKPRSFKKHNEHMGDILQDYDKS